jgi:hypothetical protein
MSGYIGTHPVPQATQHRQAFTATASQTSFATAGYTPQFVDVYLNGIKLAAEDYTTTNGSDIVLTTGAALDDILEYVAYTPFEVASQTFTGTTTVAELELESATPRITFTDTDGTDKWTSILEGNGNTYYISRNGANRGQHIWEQVDGGVYTHAMRLNSSGALLHGTTTAGSAGAGDIVVNGGVYLGGTAAANKLDDYEEGTWTPVIRGSGGDPSVTYMTANTGGIYTKVGDTVFVSFEVRWGAITGGSGGVSISGLPFARKTTAQPDGDRGTFDYYHVTVPSGGVTAVASAGTTSTNVGLSFTRSGTTTIGIPVGNLVNSNPGFIRASFTYKV